MSALLAVVQAAPAVAPVVVQHPVIDTVTKVVTQYHTQIVAGASSLLALGLGAGATFVHGILLKDRFSETINEALALIYAAALTVLALFVTGQLTSSLTFSAILATYGVTIGGNQGMYLLLHLYSKTSVPAAPAVPAADEALPVVSNP